MKKTLVFISFIIILIKLIDLLYLNNSIDKYITYYLHKEYDIIVNYDAFESNKYEYKEFSSYVKNTDNIYPSNKEEVLDVYYSSLNKGYYNFSYFCNYKNCLNDLQTLFKDAETFTFLNQLIHPYNSFKTIQSNYTISNRIDVSVTRKYSDEDINKINEKLNQIINEYSINSYSNPKDKIKIFHDYIAKTNKYDSDKEYGSSTYNSDTAIGTLFEGYSVCSGYTDTMALFLDRLGIENIKIANDKHVWNALKLDNKWYHLDLTWDDPIIIGGDDVIQYDYFLITTDELNLKNDGEHSYSKEIYNFIN